MANFTLDAAFRRLSLQKSSLCRQCRRCLSSRPAARAETTSATKAFSDHLQASRTQPSTPSRTSALPSTTATPPSQNRSSNDLASQMIREGRAGRVARAEQERQADIERQFSRADLERQVTRRFKVGDVYAPHDLTGVEMSKWKQIRRKGKQKVDVVDQLGIDPREHYKNFTIMSEYMSDMGRIKHSKETGLRPKNQRRMAKAIRRAIGIGLMPGVHRHPELLKMEMGRRGESY